MAAKRLGGRKAQATATQKFSIELRKQREVELRVDGWSLREIAADVGVSPATVCNDLTEVLIRSRSSTDERVEVERETSIERLETAIKSIMPRVREGDYKAIDRLVNLEARLAKLQGTDAPTKTEVSGPEGAPIDVNVHDTLDRKLTELAQRIGVGATQSS